MTDDVPILIDDTITKLDERHRGAVLVAGSHGGVYPGFLAAEGHLRGVILNDAGVGLEQAGIASLAFLDEYGVAAATVSHDSARIGDGQDMVARGRISHVNETARALGCAPGQATMDCAEAMRAATLPTREPPGHADSRFMLRDGRPPVIGCDSASLIRPGEDDGAVIVCASHGGVLAANPAYVLKAQVGGVVLNDAGVGIDRAGLARLAACQKAGIPAATVSHDSARIGDARSTWETGRISHFNDAARALGGSAGMSAQAFAGLLADRLAGLS